jgi:hypothetical protein
MTTQYTIGQPVEVIDGFNGHDRHVCNGNVERITKTLVIVRNEHGNECRFRLKDSLMVGYSWPMLTSQIRPLETR